MPKGTANSFGSVFSRKLISGKMRWYLYFKTNGRRIREAVPLAQSKADALRVLSLKVNAALHAEYGLKQERKRIAFRDFCELFIEKYAKPNKRSWKDDFYAVKILNRFFGKLQLHEVAAFDIESFKAARLKEVSKSRVNRNLDLVKKLFSIACDWGYLQESPARKVKRFPVFNVRERILDQGEEVRLLEASSPHLRPILIALLNTACRKAEVLTLKWSQIDLERKTIRIEKTKTGRDRIIPINSTLLSVLESLRASNGQSEHVFLSHHGKPMRNVQKSFKSAVRWAGIDSSLRVHDLRHTAASRMVEAGIDLPTVSRILGHSTIQMTMRYAHSTPESMRKAMETLSSFRREDSKSLTSVPNLSPNSKGAPASALERAS